MGLSMRDGSGPAGIAWLGTVCDSRQWRTNINEYYGDLDTAQILVHEIGHNLNMAHDFTNNNPDSPRYSSTGQPCTDIDSYMDYYNDPNRWSPCSVEDITAYYNSVGPEVYGNSCMTLLDDDTTTEAPPTDEVCINIKTTTKAWGRELDCKDGYGDGWHGGRMEVGGNTLCADFQEGHSQKQ